MSARLKTFDLIRTTQPVSGRDSYGDEDRAFPAGTEGVVLDVLGGGQAFEVEFTVHLPEIDGSRLVHAGTWHTLTLTPDQLEPAA